MVRVAFFPDSFLEVNGVAHTARNLAGYALRRELPLLCVHAGAASSTEHEGSLRKLQLRRSRLSLALEKDLIFDLSYLRHLPVAERECRSFAPDVIHITGPNDNGILGAILAHRLSIPLVASWHTNLHEYSGQRINGLLRFLPVTWRKFAAVMAEKYSLEACLRYYRLGKVLYAPNPELCSMLERRCDRTCLPMPRGVDSTLFSPEHRSQRENDGTVRIGYVGRLSTEKNVRFLAELEKCLRLQGLTNYVFTIIGHGSDESWLRDHMQNVEMAGVLRDNDLSRAYANMDLLAFPSRTDTFGNVVLEAMASGVPCVVTDKGGPKFIVKDGESGFIASSDNDFIAATALLVRDAGLRSAMAAAARKHALTYSWDSVFDRVYAGYRSAVVQNRLARVRVAYRQVS
jgi:phosphatidylinositol alpha 1,6-mannosyltransferase